MKKHLEYKDEKSHKFWQIEDFETSFTVTYGKVGGKGQSKTKEFDNEDDMLDAIAKLIDQKLKKGYKSSTTILVEKWDEELQKIIKESATNSPESIEKIKEWFTNYFTFHLEFKIAKDELNKLDKQKIQEILKMLQKQYYEEYIAVLFPSHKINAAIEEENKSNTTYLEYKDKKSHKFWQIEVIDNTFTVTYGKVGTNGYSVKCRAEKYGIDLNFSWDTNSEKQRAEKELRNLYFDAVSFRKECSIPLPFGLKKEDNRMEATKNIHENAKILHLFRSSYVDAILLEDNDKKYFFKVKYTDDEDEKLVDIYAHVWNIDMDLNKNYMQHKINIEEALKA